MIKLVIGVNDLSTTHAELCKELKDIELATKLSYGSMKKVMWVCTSGHEYPATVQKRAISGRGCPYCYGRYAIPGETDLGTLRPDLASELVDPSKATSLKLNSNVKLEWVCPEGHTYSCLLYNRVNRADGCTKCSLTRTSRPEIYLRTSLSKEFKTNGDEETRLDLRLNRRKSLSVDILLDYNDVKWIIEYDGAYYHKSDSARARDATKTVVLLDAGYQVIRVRESSYTARLGLLPLAHDNLLQLECEWKTNVNNELDKTASEIISWIRLKG